MDNSQSETGKTDSIAVNGLCVGWENYLRMDERHVFSASGKAYRRVTPRTPSDLSEPRLPYVKRVMARGGFYYYFSGPARSCRWRLPDIADAGFPHAYLASLAKLEGENAPDYQHKSKSSVYFIGCDAAIKIGVSVILKDRFATIQAASPVPLKVLTSIEGDHLLEREYHKRFAAHRLHGEWFAPHPDILAEVDRLNANQAQAA